MVRLETDPFLNELTKLFERNQETGSVWVTFKRSALKQQFRKHKARMGKPAAAGEGVGDADVDEFQCLVRATDGKVKISTAVSAREQARFYGAYATVLKAHMGALKKKDRKKAAKS